MHTRFALFVGPNGRKKVYPLQEGATPPEYVDCFDGTRLPLVMVARYEAGTVQSAELLSERAERMRVRMEQDQMQARVRDWRARRAS